MPHLRSKEGVAMLKHYVDNWVSVLLVYTNLKKQTVVKFKDGVNVLLSKSDYSQFYDHLYRKYLQDHGFHICDDYGRLLV
jgi:regulator of replication initiation timing